MTRYGESKKQPRGRRAVTSVLMRLSKAALADLVVDMAQGAAGETATDDELLLAIGEFAAPTLFARGDRVPVEFAEAGL